VSRHNTNFSIRKGAHVAEHKAPTDKPAAGSISEKMRAVFDRIFTRFAEYRWESILRSYTLASKEERRLRLDAVMDLSAALARIQQKNIYGTRLHGESLIESIIEGDWMRAKEIANDITFDDHHDDEERRYFTELWEPFRTRALVACEAALLLARVEHAQAASAAQKGTDIGRDGSVK